MNPYFRKLFITFSAVLLIVLMTVKMSGPSHEGYFFALFLGLILIFFFSWTIGRDFFRPIKEMLIFARKVSRGDYSEKLKNYHIGELKFLRDELDLMATRLQATLAEVIKDKTELQSILANMSEGVIIINKDEKIRILSAPTLDMLDLRSGPQVDRPYWEVIRNEKVNQAIKEALTQERIIRSDLSTIFPKEQYFSMRVSPLFDEKNRLSGAAAAFYDITDLKRLENIRSEFVTNVSHELKTPLTSIKGFIETLESGAIHDKENAQRFLKIIHKHTQRLEDLVNDILSLATIESKEFKLNAEKNSLAEVLKAVIGFHQHQLQAKRQHLRLELPAELPLIFLDVKRIEQVFTNLLANAIKYTPEEGKITISVREETGFIRTDIQDTGIGIAAEHLPRIFERFYRVNKDRSREMGGTGLGLSIVKHILQAHHGKITVESETEKGSTFSVFLPKNRFAD